MPGRAAHDDPIILGSPPNRPPNDYSYWRAVVRSAVMHDAVERAGVPTCRASGATRPAGARMLTIISIKQRFAATRAWPASSRPRSARRPTPGAT